MSAGLFLAAAAMAQAADAAPAPPPAQPAPAYGPSEPAPAKAAANSGATRKDCSPTTPDPDSDTIVVCVVKPDGYRIDPDILAATKAKRDADQGKARPPENYADNTCATVGPNGCAFAPAINLLAAAMTAAEIADRVSKGQEIGSVFRTDPQLTEYQYYQLAKAERERKESEAADKTYAAQVEAEAKAAPQR
jgi:hypothetical protein